MARAAIWLGIITIIISCFFGLHAFMDSANKQEVENLKSTISMLKTQRDAAESKLSDANNVVEDCHDNILLEKNEENDISERLALMQKERDILIDKALSKATNSIDPRSEIASHIALLKSESKDDQVSAVNFLFEIRDPVTFKPLQEYFINSESGHKPFTQLIDLWYELFLELDLVAGVEFVVTELNNKNSYNSRVAFETLNKLVKKKAIANEAKPNLETVALISENASARGYAKIILEKISSTNAELQ